MTQPALEVRVYETVESLLTLQREWDQLLSQFPQATTFSTLDWLVPWWRAFGKGQLKVIAFFEGRSLVALAPLAVISHVVGGGVKLNLLRLMGDGSGDSDNLDLPVRPGYEAAFIDRLLGLLARCDFRWDFCRLNTLPENSPAAAVLRSRLVQRQWPYFTSQRPQLVTHLPENWDEYLAQLTSESRNNLKRYTRRLQKHYAVQISKCTEESDLERCLEDLFRLHQKRWILRGEPGTFASAERRSFYFDLSCALLAHKNLEFWSISLNGVTAAAQFCFRFGESVFLLQEGFDPDHGADRVGFILRGHVLEQLTQQGVRRYDFLFGESEGKQIWVPQLHHYDDLHFAKPGSFGGLYLQATNMARDGKEWLRANLPNSAWAALHDWKRRGDAGQKQAAPAKEEEKAPQA
jgi:CelD/BcsL family acetyltransferase involved in cellulose biosynthesis